MKKESKTIKVLNISFKICCLFPLIVRVSVRKTSLPANLTEDVKNVIYVSSKAKRKLVEVRWSGLLLRSHSAFRRQHSVGKQVFTKQEWREQQKRTKNKESVDKNLPLTCSFACWTIRAERDLTRTWSLGQTWHTRPSVTLHQTLPRPAPSPQFCAWCGQDKAEKRERSSRTEWRK